MNNDLPANKPGLKHRTESTCPRLLSGGHRQGRLWVANNPIAGDHKQSPEFKVALTRDIGTWKDWRTGDKGDVIKLVEYLTEATSRALLPGRAIASGCRSMNQEQRRRMAGRAAEARQEAEDKAQAELLCRMHQAERIWSFERLNLLDDTEDRQRSARRPPSPLTECGPEGSDHG